MGHILAHEWTHPPAAADLPLRAVCELWNVYSPLSEHPAGSVNATGTASRE